MIRKKFLTRLLLPQNVGFLVILALTWLDELIALPSLIFGQGSVILSYRESSLKMLLVLAVWFLVAGSTRRVLAHVEYLEHFMRVCAWCHSIDFKGDWISFEEFLRKGFDTPTTHGICPTCLEKQRKALAKAKKAAVQPTLPEVACATAKS
jgi:hypothetical protein